MTITKDLNSTNLTATSIFYYLLIPTLVLWFIYWRLSRQRMYALAKKLPGPSGLPLLGNLLDVIGSPSRVFTNVWEKGIDFDKVAKIWIGPKLVVFLFDPSDVEILLSSQVYIDKSPEYEFFKPWLGDGLLISTAVFKTVIEKAKDFDSIAKLWIGPKLVIFIYDPRDVEILLSSQIYIDKSTEYDFFKPWLGDGLLISTGHKWRSHRKLIAPTFHLNVLKSFIDLFNDNSRNVVEKLKKEGSKTFDAHDYMSEATVEILLETAMGVSKKTQDQSGYEYAMAVMKMCDILHLRHRNILLRSNLLFSLTKHYANQGKLLDIIHGLTKKVIKNKKEAFEKGTRGSLAKVSNKTTVEAFNYKVNIYAKTGSVEGLSFGQSSGLKDDLDVDDNDVGEKKRLAFLDLLLESAQNGALISDTEIKEQVDTIMFEGHDTTAAASSFFLSLMGIHPNIQERVQAELDQIFGDSDRPATFQDTLEMKYLERCLMETLRMYPPVPIIARQLKEDLKLASGDYVVPAGATVTVATYKLHRNPNIYPNPNVFNPDNFLPEKQANRHYYAFVPFSAGPRSCVGRKYAMLKLKILLSTILRNFKIYSDLTEKDFQLQADIILKREEGFKVRLAPRQRPTAKAQ